MKYTIHKHTAMMLKPKVKSQILHDHKHFTHKFDISRRTLYNWVNSNNYMNPAYSYTFLMAAANRYDCKIPDLLDFIDGRLIREIVEETPTL
jgi:hypothetical protein